MMLVVFAVHLPSVIQNQMLMKQFTMMKMFLSATTAGIRIMMHYFLDAVAKIA